MVHGFERIFACSPVSWRLRGTGWSVGRPDLALSPGYREVFEKAIQIGIAMWQSRDTVPRGEAGEMVLNRSYFIEES